MLPATRCGGATPVAPSTDADVVQKVPADAGRNLDRGEILHQARNAGLGGGSLFRAVGLRLKNSPPACRRAPDRAHRDGT